MTDGAERRGNPAISIIMPVYNTGRYLPETMRSILDQTFGDFELICVDDKSTDGSLQVLRDFAAEDRRVKVIALEKNVGPANARTKGLLASAGEFVMFSDADDLFYPYTCERAIAAMREHKCDIVHFNYHNLLPDGTVGTPTEFVFPRAGRREGRTLLDVFFSSTQWGDHQLWNKICSGDMCRKAAAAMSENIPNCAPDDYYTFFVIAFHGRTYYGLPDEHWYRYRERLGYSGNVAGVLSGADIVRSCEEFLEERGALKANRGALNEVRRRIYSNGLEGLLRSRAVTPELMEHAARCWGSRILIDFMYYAGFFRLGVDNWFNVADRLLATAQLCHALQQEKARLDRVAEKSENTVNDKMTDDFDHE